MISIHNFLVTIAHVICLCVTTPRPRGKAHDAYPLTEEGEGSPALTPFPHSYEPPLRCPHSTATLALSRHADASCAPTEP